MSQNRSQSRIACCFRGALPRPLAILGAGAIVLLCGCSSFNRDWREAAKTPTPTNSITGRWEGRWHSDENGHNGALRCIVSHLEGNGGYEAHFRATYLKVARFGYKVSLRVTESNQLWHFTGSEDLGALAGGVYDYAGSASATNFNATYNSKYDHGTFEMRRPD